MAGVQVFIDERQMQALARRPVVQRRLREVAGRVAEVERAAAPKRSGAGAASIHAARLTDGRPGYGVSWDRRHTYMGIQNDRRRFAEQAARRVGGR